jgi:hypothetical protein
MCYFVFRVQYRVKVYRHYSYRYIARVNSGINNNVFEKPIARVFNGIVIITSYKYAWHAEAKNIVKHIE